MKQSGRAELRGGLLAMTKDRGQGCVAKVTNGPYIVTNDRPKVVALQRLLPANWRG